MQQTVACPNCGNLNASGQQYCVTCGAHLGAISSKNVSHVPLVTGAAAVTQPVTMSGGQNVKQVAKPVSTKGVEIKATWGLAWGLFWRTFFLWIIFAGACFLIYMLTRLALGYTSVF